MRRVLIAVLCSVASPAVAQNLPLASVQSELQKLVKTGPLEHSKTGLYVYSLSKDRVVFAHNENTLLSPASNTKIITSAAALHVLHPEYRFKTEVYADGGVKNGTVTGNLYVKGYGDPSLVSERLWFLANEMAAAGLRHVTGDIIGDDTFFDERRQEDGWNEDKSDEPYQAMVSALSVNFGTLTVRLLPAATVGGQAQVTLDPPVLFAQIDSQVSTDLGKRSKVAIDVTPLGSSRNTVKVRGHVNIDDGGHAYWRKVDYPTEFAVSAVAAFLKKAGIVIDGQEKRGTTPGTAILVTAVESPRLSEIVDDLNKTSNNFVAEMITKTLGAEVYGAPGTWEKGLRVLRDYMGELKLEQGSFILRNGSGLGDVNRVTSKQIVAVLRGAYLDAPSAPEFMSSLGVAGSTGTLRHRMIGTPAQYRVRGKTGSLANACTLSGYVSSVGGEQLAFSILVNSFKSMHAVHEAQDKIAEALAELDDRAPASH